MTEAHRTADDQDQCGRPVRVIAYSRANGVSSDPSRSIATQSERMRWFVQEHAGWTLVGEFSDVATGQSAGSLPGLRQAMAEAVAGGCDVLLVDSLDRVSRLTCEVVALVERLASARVTLWSAAGSFNGGTPDGMFAQQALVAPADYECVCRRRGHAARARTARA